MAWSAQVYQVYLKHVAPEDIHVYSIDEVFLDITPYLETAGCTPREFAKRIIQDVLAETGITATAGIGPNLYLAKIAMDIVAKHVFFYLLFNLRNLFYLISIAAPAGVWG